MSRFLFAAHQTTSYLLVNWHVLQITLLQHHYYSARWKDGHQLGKERCFHVKLGHNLHQHVRQLSSSSSPAPYVYSQILVRFTAVKL
jgi:hypothetical protein